MWATPPPDTAKETRGLRGGLDTFEHVVVLKPHSE